MENSNGIAFAGLIVICVCLAGLVLILLQNNPNRVIPLPSPAPIYLNPQQQPQVQVQPQHHHCPPPVCPPDCHHDDAKRLYMMGYRDASSGRRPNEFYRHESYYRRGYADGSPFCPSHLRFNIIID